MKVKRDNDSPLGPTMWDMQWVQDVEIADGHPGDPKHTFFFSGHYKAIFSLFLNLDHDQRFRFEILEGGGWTERKMRI